MANHHLLHIALAAPSMGIDTCVRMVDAASRSCVAPIQPQVLPSVSTGDGLAALSTTFMYGSLFLGFIAVLGAIGWGIVVKVGAEREARAEAERLTTKWLKEEATPFILRAVSQFSDAFPQEGSMSDAVVEAMTAAAGEEGKEDGNGAEK